VGISPDPADWGPRLTRSIAEQVRRHRKARGWSAQRLSDECSGLGFDFPRSTLADLESGRRANISVAELIALAAALGVPPLLLLYPVGQEAEAEVWPGEVRPAFRAALWFTGEAPSPSRASDGTEWIVEADEHTAARPLVMYRKHDQQAQAEIAALRDAEAIPQHAGLYSQLAEFRRQEAARIREQLEAEGIIPPAPVAGLIVNDAGEMETGQ